MNDAPLSSSNYTVACICPMGVELAPVQAMLDETHRSLPTSRDENSYTLGKIGEHNIVIAIMPEKGNNRAAIVATQLLNDFRLIRFVFLVGIGGGVPGEEEDQNDIRLGDVVVSKPTATFGGVVQYDLGKVSTGGFERTGLLCKPPAILLANVEKLVAEHLINGNRIPQYLSEIMNRSPQMEKKYKYPGAEHDNLFKATYPHQHGKSCASCDTGQLVRRKGRPNNEPQIHYGTIGSANAVIKDSAIRERLRKDLNIICVEMEAAGLMDTFPCLVVRGICDYTDSHKNDRWQPYAAATAAAYMKELLLIVPPKELAEEIQIRDAIADMRITVKGIEEIVAMVRSDSSMKVMDRLSAVDFWGKQHDVYSRAEKGTGT
jgi:nucleoside phosphorylase